MHYMQGSLLTVADTLSRATLTDCQTEVDENELNCFVHSIISNYLISDSRLQQFQDETQKDKTLRTVKKFIQDGCQVNHLSCRQMYVYILLIIKTCVTLMD